MGRATAVRFRQGEPLIRLIAQRQSARLISERSGVRSPVGLLVPGKTQNCSPGEGTSKLAQRKRAWLITRRSEDRNLHLLYPHHHCTYDRTIPSFAHTHTPRTYSKSPLHFEQASGFDSRRGRLRPRPGGTHKSHACPQQIPYPLLQPMDP